MARNPQPSADPVLLDTSSDSDSPPPPQIITRRQASSPRSVPPRSPDLSREVSTNISETSTKLPQSPVETVAQFMGLDLHPPRAPTNQSDSSEAAFWHKIKDNLLAQAAELRKQGDELHKQGYVLYDRANKLRDMAAECEGEESDYPSESW